MNPLEDAVAENKVWAESESGTRCMVPFGGTLGVFGTLLLAYAVLIADKPISASLQMQRAEAATCLFKGFTPVVSFDSRRHKTVGQDYVVEDRGDGKGLGVYTLRPYASGELIAVVSGEIVGEHRLHTLQLTADTHLYDPEFTGCLLHSCDPNAIIDPAKREVTALKDIGIDEAITVDYAHTEDRLVKQFACKCGSPNCRRWIKGRKEEITAEGREYLACFKTG